MEILARLIKLTPNSAERVQAWAEHINAHRVDALASLKAEGIESWFSLSLDGKDYLLCYMRADSMDRSQQVAANSENPVGAYHQQFEVDTWVRGAGAVSQLLVDLSSTRGYASASGASQWFRW